MISLVVPVGPVSLVDAQATQPVASLVMIISVGQEHVRLLITAMDVIVN